MKKFNNSHIPKLISQKTVHELSRFTPASLGWVAAGCHGRTNGRWSTPVRANATSGRDSHLSWNTHTHTHAHTHMCAHMHTHTCVPTHTHTHTCTHIRMHTFFYFLLLNSIILTNIMCLQKLRSHNTDAVPVSSVENKAHLVQHVTSRRKVYDNGLWDGGCCAGKKALLNR